MSTTWNRSIRGFALLLCLFLVVAPVVRVEAMAANTGVLRATVTVGTSHSPVELITVRVVDLETAEEVAVATTDEAGIVVLPELPLGTYHVSAVAPEGFVVNAGPLVIVSEEAAAEVAITLAPAQEGQDAETEDDCEDGDDDCVAAAAAAAAAVGGGGATTGLILLGILGAAGITIGIAGVADQDGAGPDVITQ